MTTDNSVASLTVQGLNPDTTYYLKVGSLFSGATSYSATQPSTSTLTNLLTPSVFGVSSNTVTVNWPAFAINSGTNTAQGYELDASTSSNFVTYASSLTTVVAQSTLTISGLTPFTTYYLRAGSINWNSVVNCGERTQHTNIVRSGAERGQLNGRLCDISHDQLRNRRRQ